VREDRPDDGRIVGRGDETQPAPTGWTRQHVNRKGVHWTREWPSKTVFGELDFVVVNRAGKALLIE